MWRCSISVCRLGARRGGLRVPSGETPTELGTDGGFASGTLTGSTGPGSINAADDAGGDRIDYHSTSTTVLTDKGDTITCAYGKVIYSK